MMVVTAPARWDRFVTDAARDCLKKSREASGAQGTRLDASGRVLTESSRSWMVPGRRHFHGRRRTHVALNSDESGASSAPVPADRHTVGSLAIWTFQLGQTVDANHDEEGIDHVDR